MCIRMGLTRVSSSVRSICAHSNFNSISWSMLKIVKVHIVLRVQYQIPFNIKFNLKFPYHIPKWIQFHVQGNVIGFLQVSDIKPPFPQGSAPASLRAKGSLSSSIPMGPWRLAGWAHGTMGSWVSRTWSWWEKKIWFHSHKSSRLHSWFHYYSITNVGLVGGQSLMQTKAFVCEIWNEQFSRRFEPQGVSTNDILPNKSSFPGTKHIPKPWGILKSHACF